MRHLFLLFIALTIPLLAQAQHKVSEDDLEGEWKMVFHLEEATAEADNAFARIALRAVAGIMSEVDIRVSFDDDGEYLISTSVFGLHDDDDDDDDDDEGDDEGTWYLTKHGGLVLGDSVHINSDEDTVFYFVDGDLQGFELNDDGKPGERKEVSLQRASR